MLLWEVGNSGKIHDITNDCINIWQLQIICNSFKIKCRESWRKLDERNHPQLPRVMPKLEEGTPEPEMRKRRECRPVHDSAFAYGSDADADSETTSDSSGAEEFVEDIPDVSIQTNVKIEK